MSDYFDPLTVTIPAGTRALASQVNAVSNAISAGFDKLPTETELKLGLTRYAVDTGVADAYVLTLPYTPVLTDGFNLIFKAVNANTGACTINVNSTGVKSIVNPDGTALAAGAFGANAIIIIAYESVGDRYILVSQNPAQAAQAAASAAAALASENAAALSESNAATSEANALNSENAAALSETNAGNSETAAGVSETNAAASFTEFDARYLGSKVSDPTLDNDGLPLIDGALYWNTTVNAMRVYDLGGAAWVPFSSIADAATLDGLDSTQFLRSDAGNTLTTTETTADSLAITETTLTSGQLLNVSSNNAGKTTPVATIEQIAGGSAAVSLALNQSGTGAVLTATGGEVTLAAGTTNYPSLQIPEGVAPSAPTDGDVWVTAAGGFFARLNGVSVDLANPAAAAGGSDTQVQYNNGGILAGMSGVAWNDANNTLLWTAANTTETLLEINSASGLTSGKLLRLYQNQSTFTGNMLEIVQDNASSTADIVRIQGDGGTGMHFEMNTGSAIHAIGNNLGGALLDLDHNGSAGSAIEATAGGAGVRAGYFYSNVATRTVPLVVIDNDNATGSGEALNINNDSSGYGINLNSDGGGILVSGIGTGQDGMFINHLSTAGTGLRVVAASAADTVAALFSSAVANRTQPVVRILNDSATGSDVNGPALRIQNDMATPHIDLLGTNGVGIKFPATANPSTDANTLDDYQEGTYNPTITTGTGTVTLNASFDTLQYTKIGDTVFISGEIRVGSVSTPSGVATISLPFANRSRTQNADIIIAPIHVQDCVTAADGFTGLAIDNTFDIGVAETRIVTSATLGNAGAEFQAGTDLRFNFHYHTSD